MNRILSLLKVIDTGSFTKAATELGYTQSSISQSIASLENEFNVQLLHRSKSGIKLTPAGTQLYPHFQQIMRKYLDTQEVANQINGLQTGTVRIGAINGISSYWLPGLIKGFETIHPQVHFTLYQGDYDEVRNYIKTGKVDFGFLRPPFTKDLKTEPIKKERLLAVVPKNHPLSKQSKISLIDLYQQSNNIILIPEGSHSAVLHAFAQLKINPHIKDKIQDDYTVMAMIGAGLGVSMVSELIVKNSTFAIKGLPTTPEVSHTIQLAYTNRASLSIASKHFIDYVITQKEKLL